MRNEWIADLEQQRTEPMALAPLEARRLLNPYDPEDPRYTPTIDEEIERLRALSQEELRQLYEKFLGAQAGELSIVGDFDPQEVRQTLTDIFDDWKGEIPYRRIPRPANTKVKGTERTIVTPDKANAMYFAMMELPLRDDHEDYPAMVIGNFVLGGGTLSSRLGNRVRQKEGLSYGVRSSLQASSLDERATFVIYAIANPQNIQRVKTVIREELDRLLRDGVTPEELEAAKQAYLKREEVSRSDDRTLAAILADSLLAGRTMAYDAGFEQRIRELTVEKVNQALRRHIQPDRLVIVTAGDFAADDAGGK